jgi:hypothetical protein
MALAKNYYFILQFSPVIPLIYGILHYRRLDGPLRIIVLWLFLSISFTIVMAFLVKQGINTLWLMNISLPLYVFFVLWVISLWETRSDVQLFLRMAIIFFAIVWTVEITVTDSLFRFTTFSRPLMNVLFVAASYRIIYEGNKEKKVLLTNQPKFWIAFGLMLYYGGMFLINLWSNRLLQISNDSLRYAFLAQPPLILLSNIFYAIGFQRQCRE